ncbi:MAG TPA: deoxyribodipyrimidine photo-lyase [Gaiellaceae bacterium]|nr:deoxyribodipyrimidine photo-lyase [Gaiellaceae bacterium]
MKVAVVLFTRDLRVRDHPALAEAVAAAERVVPLFVLDDAILADAGANRVRFLLEALADLRTSLRALGGQLVVRRGDPVAETAKVAREAGAETVFASADASAYAQARERRLREERLELRLLPGVAVVPPGELLPAGGDHFRVFTPYWRRWSEAELRPVRRAPRRLSVPAGTAAGRLPALTDLIRGEPSPDVVEGGETAGRARLARWLRSGLERYGARHDDLAGDATSRLSPYLHFGCLTPREVVERAADRPGAGPFLRQLAWRDFFHQLLAARPEASRADYRPRRDRWNDDPEGLAAWREGRTGVPLVDAGMRQLAREGWMHNRARLVTASFLTKSLYVDWRLGADHFARLLVDGDVASNAGNWQWVAGTGADTRPNRILNPLLQARRYDPEGDYVRRYVEELGGVEGGAVHEPWKASGVAGYPPPLVEHTEAVARFRRARRR